LYGKYIELYIIWNDNLAAILASGKYGHVYMKLSFQISEGNAVGFEPITYVMASYL
jgi:hypothetical protein